MTTSTLRHIANAGPLAAAVLVASCAAPPPAAPPPPRAVTVIPPKPMPPRGAAEGQAIPPVGPDGTRQTVNARLSVAQTTWNVRSALNVAALNCLKPAHADILVGYKAFLKTQAKALTATNRAVDQEFKTRYGSGYIVPREKFMTQVYNYFALPPTRDAFCDASLSVAREAGAIKKGELDAFAARNLPRLEAVYEAYFREYEAYRAALATWQAAYGSSRGYGAAVAGPTQSIAVSAQAASAASASGAYGPAEVSQR